MNETIESMELYVGAYSSLSASVVDPVGVDKLIPRAPTFGSLIDTNYRHFALQRMLKALDKNN